MPLFYQHHINGNTRLGIWRIEESEAFFLAQVPVKRDVSHPHKRLQHLAGRYLLTILFPDFPLREIRIADTRKPYLEDEQYHFSISHCGDYAAAIVSSEHRVGIDVERPAPAIGRIRAKFLGDEEQALAMAGIGQRKPAALDFLTMLWSAKEAVFKWYSLGGINFREHLQVRGAFERTGAETWDLPFAFRKGGDTTLLVHCHRFEGLVMSWVMGARSPYPDR